MASNSNISYMPAWAQRERADFGEPDGRHGDEAQVGGGERPSGSRMTGELARAVSRLKVSAPEPNSRYGADSPLSGSAAAGAEAPASDQAPASASTPAPGGDRPRRGEPLRGDEKLTALPLSPHKAKLDLLRRMDIVRKARFHAHARLEAKNTVSIMALAFAGMFGLGVTLYTLTFGGDISAGAMKGLNFTSAMTSVFGLAFGLTEAMKGYSTKAAQMHDCARRVNALRQRLELTEIGAMADIQRFDYEYQLILDQCPINHQPVDYLKVAAAALSRKSPRALADWRRIAWANIRYIADVYFACALIVGAPLMISLLVG